MLARGNNGRQRTYTAVGLLFGAIGDYLICIHGHGLFLGATAFAIGHIFYLVCLKNFSKPFIILYVFIGSHLRYISWYSARMLLIY